MKIEGILWALAFLFPFGGAYGQSPSLYNAGPGLYAPADTTRALAFTDGLPSLSAFPSNDFRKPTGWRQAPEAPQMPSAYSYEKLGVFCKWEVKLEKAAQMPIKFRLGEVQYVERMEGKLPDY